MTAQFTLGKNERLKSRKSIEQLFKEGKKLMVTPYRVFFLLKPADTPSLLFGAGVSSRTFKRAADRNRIKRLTREAYRLQKGSLQEKISAKHLRLDIFFIYTAKEIPVYQEVYKKVGLALKSLEKAVAG